MSPSVWSEVRDAVRPSVAAGQLLPHRAAQISSKYRVDLSDVTRIYIEERDKFLARTGQPADPVPTAVGAEPTPAPAPKPDGTPRCPHCRQGFDSQQQLSAHLRVHPEALVVPCDLCDVRSISKSALAKHKDKQHAGWRKAKKNSQPATRGDAAAPNTGQPGPVDRVNVTATLAGLAYARKLVAAFATVDCSPQVSDAVAGAVEAIDRLRNAIDSAASELTARADELRAELARLETQLAQVQEAAA